MAEVVTAVMVSLPVLAPAADGIKPTGKEGVVGYLKDAPEMQHHIN